MSPQIRTPLPVPPALQAVTSAIKSRNNTELSLIESSLMTEAYHLVDEDSFLLVVEAGE